MHFNEQLQSIHDINLSYLLLAQQLIREDKFAAGFRLGLPETTIDIIKDLIAKVNKISFHESVNLPSTRR